MKIVTFPCTVRLVPLLAPFLLMAVSTLCLIDSFNAFLDPAFQCIKLKPSRTYSSPAQRVPSSVKDRQNSELKTAIVFLFEIFSGIINFLTGGIFLLLNFCCLITKQTVDRAFGKRVRVPFPKKTNGNYPTELVSFVEFSSFLAAVAGTFGALMMITTMGLRYRSSRGNMMELNAFDGTILELNSTKTKNDLPLCLIHQTSGLANAIFMFCVDIVLVTTTITSKRIPTCGAQVPIQLDNCSRSKADEYSLLHNSSIRAKKVACFCLDLTRLILMLASVLITCGGLNVLGGVLQLLQTGYASLTTGGQAQIRPRVREMACIVDGILSLCCGLLAVISIHCCSTPLEVLFTQVYRFNTKCENTVYRFSQFAHLLTMSAGLVTLPMSTGAYILLRFDFRDYSYGIFGGHHKYVAMTSYNSDVQYVGYTLCSFASLIAFLVCSTLLICLLVDIYIRIMLMDYRPSLISLCQYGNSVDEPLPGSINQATTATNHYSVSWTDSKSLAPPNTSPFNYGNFIKIENHINPANFQDNLVMNRTMSILHHDKMGISRNYLTVNPSNHLVTAPRSLPVTSSSEQGITGRRAHPTTELCVSIGEANPRLSRSVGTSNYCPSQQNHLTYICNENGNTNGIISAESPATTATQASQPKENPDHVCEYMSCDIGFYPELTAPPETADGHHMPPNSDMTFVGEPHQTVWYYDLVALREGTFTSV